MSLIALCLQSLSKQHSKTNTLHWDTFHAKIKRTFSHYHHILQVFSRMHWSYRRDHWCVKRYKELLICYQCRKQSDDYLYCDDGDLYGEPCSEQRILFIKENTPLYHWSNKKYRRFGKIICSKCTKGLLLKGLVREKFYYCEPIHKKFPCDCCKNIHNGDFYHFVIERLDKNRSWDDDHHIKDRYKQRFTCFNSGDYTRHRVIVPLPWMSNGSKICPPCYDKLSWNFPLLSEN